MSNNVQQDRNHYLDAWAKTMITIWQEKVIQQNIRDTGELLESFNNALFYNSNGDVVKIIHTYMYYGRMVDMGVGKGVNLDEVKHSDRKPKKWYNKVYYRSIKVMSEKLAELYGEEFQAILFETLS